MNSAIEITRSTHSKLPNIDFNNLQFGSVFSDHMFAMEFEDGSWKNHRIEPFGPIKVHPVSASLHYGQAIFEGLKSYRGSDNQIRIFRPEMNHERMNTSCDRMCMPRVDRDTFLGSIEQLINVDRGWVPPGATQALYIRPVMFANEGQLDVRPANHYKFLIITSPVDSYFGANSPAVALKAEEKFTRAIQGGTGFAKAGGNYAATFLATNKSRGDGFAQVLWLDGVEHRYIEEVGQMNICFYLDGKLVTPALRGTILPGVTRNSVLHLVKDMGIECEERLIDIQEIIDGAQNGRLHEAFGCGTAAIITAVGSIGYQGKKYEINCGKTGPLSQKLFKTILGIQRGELEDPYGWTRVISVE